jgi:Protein of unknown function (DUF3592)
VKTLTLIKYLFTLIGGVMLIGAVYVAVNTRSFLAHAIRTEGKVVALQPRHSSNSSSNSTTNPTGSSSLTYAPLVRFTHGGQVIDFTASTSSNPHAYHIGELVPVLYDEAAPFKARIDSFFSIWGGPIVVGGLGTVFLSIGGLMIIVPRMRAKADDRLAHEGIAVDADLQGVDLNTALTVNGKNPFRITAQWHDPATSRLYVFVSHNIWFDPSKYIIGKSVRVFIAQGNPKRYYVDLSFLPALAN